MDEGLLLKIGAVEDRHWWFAVRRRIVLEALDRTRLPHTARVIEIGCGTGSLLSHLVLAHPAWRLTGIEPSPAAAKVALNRGCDVRVGALPQLDLPDGIADAVLALDVLEHCEDDAAAAAEIARVLKPGGRLVATVPALPSLWSVHDEDNAHFRRYTSTTLAGVLASSGFECYHITYLNMLLLPLGYVSRFAANLTGSRSALGVDTPPGWLNATLRGVFSLEIPFVRRARLPVGMSLLAVARRLERRG